MKILVISAHPDDETLGCGGTLVRHRDQGDELAWAVVTAAYVPVWTEQIVRRKQTEKESVAASYGIESPVFMDLPAARLDTVPFEQLIQSMDEVVEKTAPEIVYIVHGGDVHSDHRIVHQAILSALRPPRMRDLGVKRILSYETLSSTEAGGTEEHTIFVPNLFIDISRYIDKKIDIMNLYASETQADPMPRGVSAIRALARYRGATIGVEYAEAFMLVREII